MKILREGTRPSVRASSDYFTGTVWQDPLIEAEAPARLRGLRVTFEPGARTAWHTHPLGQTLIVVSGVGRVQLDGEAVQEIKPGDTVWIAPGEKHWHGASPSQGMVHLAFQEATEDGKHAVWLEHVSDEDYGAVAGMQPGSHVANE